ncbi:Superoxide dismutase (Cu-Zn) 4AP [Citrus sinensis]|uniref:Superoxide dismutase (Cu-Zn) 4AP n=1 Tax=Citrus sinensis TaxID=2711 RepID=A0ACB8KJC2_CITSI|nr:Superoxide dismutase (Cu-Zn) 4AP [Citrus sinensis]
MEKAASLKLTLLVAVLFCFVNSTKSTGVPHGNKVNAIAVITGREGGPKGSIFFYQDGDHGPTILNGYLHGLPPGHHGFHVHAAGDTRHECNSAGSHFNPHNMLHGSKEDEHRHAGDLGNLIVDAYGNAYLSHFLDNKIRLTGPHSIIGRAIVIHKDQDDFGRGGHNDSKSTGHAGERIACGVIGLLSY